jgi:hypothetical protein
MRTHTMTECAVFAAQAFPGIPPGGPTIKMNTLTENELTEVTASGDPVANWPVIPYVPSLPSSPWPGVVGGRDPLMPRMTDS